MKLRLFATDVGAERGSSIIELLAALFILSICSLAMAYNSISGLIQSKGSIRNSAAAQLALAKMEELASVDPTTLDATDNLTESSLMVNNVPFTRVTTVVVNADSTPSVTVTVTGGSGDMTAGATMTTKFVLWGNS